MTERSSQTAEYVYVRDSKPKKTTRYYYDADDDDEYSQGGATTRRIIRPKPAKEQRIRYVMADDVESDYRRPRQAELSDRGIKIRHTLNGEQVILDEDNNVLKIIRSGRSTPPPPTTIVENPRLRVRPRQPQTLYYETPDGHLVARSSGNHSLTRLKNDFVYAEDEPTKVLRRVIVDPRTGERETIYAKEKPKKQVQQKYIIRKRATEMPVESENDYEQQQQEPQYVQVVERRVAPKTEPSPTKFVMIRKKVDGEQVQVTPSSPIPAGKTVRRIVYETPTKKTTPTYVYATNGKYYK